MPGLRCSSQPEVENLHPAFAGQHDVARFQIAMDDSGGMRGGEPVSDLGADSISFRSGSGPLDQARQRLAVDQFGDDERSPSWWPMSKTLTMLGWLRALAARASRSKRAMRSGSLANAIGSTLMATSRFSRDRGRARPRPCRRVRCTR